MPSPLKSDPEPPFIPKEGWGWATRIGIELVVATLVGTLLGYLLDRLLSTRPWLMIVGLFLGAGAGFRNIVRYLETELKKQDGKST